MILYQFYQCFFYWFFTRVTFFTPKNFRRASRGICWLIKTYKSLFLQRSAPQAKKICFCTLFTRFLLIFATFCPDFFTIDQKKLPTRVKNTLEVKKHWILRLWNTQRLCESYSTYLQSTQWTLSQSPVFAIIVFKFDKNYRCAVQN